MIKRELLPILTLILGALTSASCQESGPGDSGFTVRDSAGIQIVESSAPLLGPDEGWTVSEEPILQIGERAGAEPYLFSRVVAAIRLTNGSLAILDGRSREIRVFNSVGEHLATFGGEGEGPGEFSYIPQMIPVSADTLLAWDRRQLRLSWFLTDGTLLRDERLSTQLRSDGMGSLANSHAWVISPDGTFLTRDLATRDSEGRVVPTSMPQGDGLVSTDVVFHFIRGLGAGAVLVPDTFPWSRTYHRGSVSAKDPFHRTTHHAITYFPVEVLLSNPGSWQFSAYSADGVLRRIVRASIPRQPVTGDMIEVQQENQIQLLERLGVDRSAVRRAWGNLSLPDSAPAISKMLWDGAEHLWVRRWFRDDSEMPRIYDVIDIGGRWLGTVEIPVQVGEILSFGPEHVLTLWKDDLDVEYLRMYSLDRGSAGSTLR